MDEKKTHTLGSHLSGSSNYTPPADVNSAVGTVGEAEGEKIVKELEELKKKIVKKFPFTLAFVALPHQSFKFFEEDEGLTPEEIAGKPIHAMIIIPEDEYKNIAKKIKPEIVKLVKESKQKVWVHIKTPVDVWNYGLDSKFEMIDALGAGLPLHDKGILGALRVANIHKTLVLRKFEKYVATYAVGGSLVRGTADKDSDVDTFVIIDDTDVKKMPRLQLKEKLRAWINDYIREATMRAGVGNVLNVQVYLLTEFWESVKDANPVIFTFIRDGIPMYDRGTFLPWKLLLRMGKIKPSPEAVDNFMKYGEQNDSIVKRRLMDAMIDIYWGVITPMQALMMLAGHAPPVPKTIVEDVKKEFVVGQKILGIKELKTLEKAVKLYKDYEHGALKDISGAEIDSLLRDANDYDKKLKVLRKKLEDNIMKNSADSIYAETSSLLKRILDEKNDSKLASRFISDFVKKGKLSQRYGPMVREVLDIKKKIKTKGFSQAQLDSLRKDSAELINAITEYVQRKEIANLEKNAIKISYSGKTADLVLTPRGAYLVRGNDIEHISKNSLIKVKPEELETAMAESREHAPKKIEVHVFTILKKELGEFEVSLR